MALESYSRGEKVTLAGVVVAAVGSFLPWVKVSLIGTQTVTGIDGGDGLIVLGIVAAVGIALLVRDLGRIGRGLVALSGLVVAGLAAMYINDPVAGVEFESQSEAELAQAVADPAFGLYVVLVGGILVVVGAALGFHSGRSSQRVQQTSTRR